MRGLLIDCPVHGIQEDPSLMKLTGGSDITILGSTSTCPQCGRAAPIIDGQYAHDVETDSIKAHLSLTPAQLRKLQNAVAWAQAQVSSPAFDEEMVERKLRRTIEREAPDVLRLADAALGTKGAGLAAWITVILTLMTCIFATQTGEISEEQVRSIVDEVYQQERSFDTPTTTPRQEPTDRPEPQQPERLHVRSEPPELGTTLGSSPTE